MFNDISALSGKFQEVTAVHSVSVSLSQHRAILQATKPNFPIFFCRPTPVVLPAIRTFLYESNSRQIQVDSYVNRMVDAVLTVVGVVIDWWQTGHHPRRDLWQQHKWPQRWLCCRSWTHPGPSPSLSATCHCKCKCTWLANHPFSSTWEIKLLSETAVSRIWLTKFS
jgi:hypothetical protein